VTLPRPVLDDLAYDDLIASALRRIPGAAGNRWTHHAPSDPGITLLELLAWLIEQRLYWLDRVPDELVRALLALLGETPRNARSATTVLAAEGAAWSNVAAATEFDLLDPDRPRTFTADAVATAVAPLVRVGLRTADGERGAELAEGRAVDLLPADGGDAASTFVLWFAATLPLPRPAAPLSLLFDLEAAPGIAPGWSPRAVDGVEPAADLVWSVGTGPGLDAAAPRRRVEVDDGTGGLRRSGLVRLPLPDDWQPAGPPDAGGAVPYALHLATGTASFTSPPRLRRVVANAVAASHWKSVEAPAADLAATARSWLKLPAQSLPLAGGEAPPIADSVELTLSESAGDESWRPVGSFAFHGPADRVFRVDRKARRLDFGDGLTGRVPVPADPLAPAIGVRYRAGGGGDGNLGAGRLWESSDAGLGLTARNPVPAADGEEAESVATAAERYAAALGHRERAVTAGDHVELAVSTPGVAIARAHAAVGHHPLHPCDAVPGALTLFVVPWAPRPAAAEWRAPVPGLVRAPHPDRGALGAVRRRLEARRLVTSRVFVEPVRYRPVSLAVSIAAEAADPEALEELVAAALERYLDPLAGGDGGDGWPFGEPVRPSALMRRVEEVLGDDGDVERVAVGLDGEPPDADCEDSEIEPHELVHLDRLTVTWLPSTSSGELP